MKPALKPSILLVYCTPPPPLYPKLHLGENYRLRLFVNYKLLQCDAKGSSRGGDESAKRDAVGALPGQNSQV